MIHYRHISNISLLVSLFVFLLVSCRRKDKEIPDESYVAFSLREAQKTLNEQADKADSNLFYLGGITRLVGMVIDKQNNDIILIGKKSSQLPSAKLEDFVIALRSRFLYDENPLVSIDPTATTNETGFQTVRFGGHIENTSFGTDFLTSDIFLKKYSLELVQQIPNINSYKKLFIDNEIIKLKKKGIKAVSIKPISIDSINNYIGKSLDSGAHYQSRFWYKYKVPCDVEINDNVFCIKSMDIRIDNEITLFGEKKTTVADSLSKSSPADQFANSFTKNFYLIANSCPAIKRVKLLFDMTAMAQGLKITEGIPDISFLLNKFPVRRVTTLKQFKLIKIGSIINQSDGKLNLVQLSGGLEPSIDIRLLNAGDVSYLSKFVINSRPSKKTLFWRIPVDSWEMPNHNGLDMKKPSEKNQNGCSIYVNIATVDNNISKAAGTKRFNGFSIIETANALPVGGVDFRMTITNASFKHIDSLKKIRNMILNH